MATGRDVIRKLGHELIDLSYKDLTKEDLVLLIRSLRESASLIDISLRRL